MKRKFHLTRKIKLQQMKRKFHLTRKKANYTR